MAGSGAGVIVKAGRGAAAALTLVLLQAPPAPATAGIFGGGGSAALNVCAAERAPLVDLQKQYDQLEHSRMAKSVGVGALAAGATLLSGLGGGRFAGFGGGDSGGSSGGLSIFGGGGGSKTEQVMTAVAVGVFASVATYVALKSDGINDRRSLALAVDNDARGQVGVGRTTAQSARALTACRQRQIADFQARAASAPSPKAMAREKADIADAIRQDIALTDKVIGRQSDLAKTFTQARAMAEGSSETQVLGGQSAAYQGAGAAPQQLPSNSPLANQPPPPKAVEAPRAVVTTIKATPVRAAPSAKAKVLTTLPPRQEVTPAQAAPAPGWTPVLVDGQTGYVRAVSLSGTKAAPPSSPNALAPAENVREYNKVVLEARDEGPNRMRSLLTNFS